MGVLELVARVPWVLVVVLCLTVGLAPLQPEPHLVQKLRMLGEGELRDPVDVLDLLLHAAPWVLLVLRGIAAAVGAGGAEPADPTT